jgi:MobA-like NTP transferase protein
MIGLLPAGGRAARLNGLPKYLLPIPDGNLLARHVRQMHDAGAPTVLIAAGHHNMGILSQYAPANTETYAVASKTVGEAILAARPMARERRVLFGMPDTYWDAADVYEQLAHSDAVASVALWIMREDQRGRLGQCDVSNHAVSVVIDKDPTCEFPWIWGALSWSPAFWRYIQPEHTHLGQAIQAALDAGERIAPVLIDGDYHDCGTFDSYARLCAGFIKEYA